MNDYMRGVAAAHITMSRSVETSTELLVKNTILLVVFLTEDGPPTVEYLAEVLNKTVRHVRERYLRELSNGQLVMIEGGFVKLTHLGVLKVQQMHFNMLKIKLII